MSLKRRLELFELLKDKQIENSASKGEVVKDQEKNKENQNEKDKEEQEVEEDDLAEEEDKDESVKK